MTPCPQCGSPADLGLVMVYCTNRACSMADKTPKARDTIPAPVAPPPGGTWFYPGDRVTVPSFPSMGILDVKTRNVLPDGSREYYCETASGAGGWLAESELARAMPLFATSFVTARSPDSGT